MLRKITDIFLSAWALMSRIPLPQPRVFMAAGIPYMFPVIGLIVSCFTALLMGFALTFSEDPFIGVIAVLMIQYWAFNLFHFDGLLDTMDAVLSFKSKEERLDVLGDPHHGSFALFFGVMYLLLKIHLLENTIMQINDDFFSLIFIYPLAGRLSPLVVMATMTPAKKSGLGSQLGTISVLKGTGIVVMGITITGGLTFLLAGYAGLAAVSVAALATAGSGLAVAILYRVKIGGFTGDALGFSIELGELLYLYLFYIMIQ